MKASKPAKDGHHSVMLIPPLHRRVALIVNVRTLEDARPARDTAAALASQAFKAQHVELSVVLEFRADIPDLSYRSASPLYRTDRSVETRTYL